VAIVGATMNEHGLLSIETNASRAVLRMAINERRRHRTENPDQIRARDLAVDVSVGIRLVAVAVVVNLWTAITTEEAIGYPDCVDRIGRTVEPQAARAVVERREPLELTDSAPGRARAIHVEAIASIALREQLRG